MRDRESSEAFRTSCRSHPGGSASEKNVALRRFTQQPYRDTDQVIYNAGSGTVIVVRTRGRDPGQVDLTELSPDGDTVWSRRMSLKPIPLPPTDVDEMVEAFAESLANNRGVGLADARRVTKDAMYVPEHYPPVRDVAMPSNGELWMRTWEDANSDSLSVWYAVRVGEPQNESPVRRILLPTRFSPHDATDAHVWGVRRDAFDVRYVVGRRLVPQEGADG